LCLTPRAARSAVDNVCRRLGLAHSAAALPPRVLRRAPRASTRSVARRLGAGPLQRALAAIFARLAFPPRAQHPAARAPAQQAQRGRASAGAACAAELAACTRQQLTLCSPHGVFQASMSCSGPQLFSSATTGVGYTAVVVAVVLLFGYSAWRMVCCCSRKRAVPSPDADGLPGTRRRGTCDVPLHLHPAVVRSPAPDVAPRRGADSVTRAMRFLCAGSRRLTARLAWRRR
jgi:hypothetical protein